MALARNALRRAPRRIDSIWLDTRNVSNNTDSQLFYSYSIDGGDTWSPNVAVSNSFNPFLGYPNQNKMGDYSTIVSDDTGVEPRMPPPLTPKKTSISFASPRRDGPRTWQRGLGQGRLCH